MSKYIFSAAVVIVFMVWSYFAIWKPIHKVTRPLVDTVETFTEWVESLEITIIEVVE